MGGLRFLITIFVVYLIFRTIMRRVLSTVNEEGDAPSKGKMGEIISRMKREMDRARRDAQREALGEDGVEVTDEGDWETLESEEVARPETSLLFDEPPSWEAEADVTTSRERWAEVDETPSLWDRQEETLAVSSEVAPPSSHGACHRRRRRIPLKQALIWKEILDSPVGLRP